MRGFLAVLLALTVVAVTEGVALAAPELHAHRGGSVLGGVPTYPENTMPAFRNAAKNGWVLELDVKITSDGQPVVIHDVTVDRTTVCTGRVVDMTLAQVLACPTDVLGSPGSPVGSAATDKRILVPRLSDVLNLLKKTGAVANIEIKNVPTDDDFDPTDRFAQIVAGAIQASKVPAGQVIVQSFWPPNLDVIETHFGGRIATSLLTLNQMNAGGPALAVARSYEWVSPEYSPQPDLLPALVAEAHALGRKVVPWTLDDPTSVKAAAAAGVDAIITDDPVMASAALQPLLTLG